jgi:hypothetical protein
MVFAIGATFTSRLQDVHAQVNLPTYAYINVAPNPAGVGQTVTIDFWLGVPILNSAYPVGMTIYVGLPDGTNTTLGPFLGDETGGSHTTYTPETTGTYTFYMKYAGQTLVGADAGDYEEPSTSATATLTVSTTPASEYPFTPLPTTYWQAPVNANNVQNWYAITGPWLGLGQQSFDSTGAYNATAGSGPGGGNYNPYTAAPTTGHILWTTPWAEGGVAGGGVDGGGPAAGTESGDYWITSQYEPKWAPVVINGIMYSTWYTATTSDSNGIRALDLYTGQQLWVLNTNNPLMCGMVTYYETINEYGFVGPYIWTVGTLPASQTGGVQIPTYFSGSFGFDNQYNMYDALTGEYVASIVNGATYGFLIPQSVLTTDQNGNLLMYYYNDTKGTETIYPNELASSATPVTITQDSLCMFNFTQCLQSDMQSVTTGGATDWLWEPPLDTVYQFSLGLMMVAPISTSMSSIPEWGIGGIGSNTLVLQGGNLEGEFGGGETAGYLYSQGYSLTNLALLWSTNITETPYTRTAQFYGSGVYTDINVETDVINGYSLNTGDLLWTNTLTGSNGGAPNPYDTFDIYAVVGNGVIYMYGFGGDMWAVSLTNGDILWYQNTTALFGSPGLETPYGTWPLWIFGNVVTNGQLIMYAGGHEYDPPLFHGSQEFALNCTTGKLVWSVLGFDTTGIELSYGILLGLNSYDGQIYAYGQGPSQTTVTAPDIGVTTATPVTITGTVMDVSAGTTQQAIKAAFPNGVACVSDADMGHWMAYVYEQQPEPTNVMGVPVTFTDIDPNGNSYTIGTATTDSSGTYAFTWTPPISGSYTIIATFAGSGGYYGSCAETHLYAGTPAATAAPAPTPLSLATTQNDITYGVIAIIVVIIIIGAVLAILMLRKKP